MIYKYAVDGYVLEHDRAENTVTARAIVSECKGSWRWQDAYRTAWYGIRYSPRQHCHFFRSVALGRKMSGPQLSQAGIDYPSGSLHNRRVPASVLWAIGTLTA
jgi:hypothetical protein